MVINFNFLFNEGGGGGEAVLKPIEITEDGTYTPESGVDGFSQVVAKHEFEPPLHLDRLDESERLSSAKGYKTIYFKDIFEDNVETVTMSENGKVDAWQLYNPLSGKIEKNWEVNVQPHLDTLNITRGDAVKEYTFDPEDFEGYDGWGKVQLNMPLTKATITQNGTYKWQDVDADAHRLYWGWGEVEVNVQGDVDYTAFPQLTSTQTVYTSVVNGKTYVSGTFNGEKAVYEIDGDTCTKIISGVMYNKFYLAKNGALFISSDSSSNQGLYVIDNSGVNQITNASYNWYGYFEATDGTVYIGGSGGLCTYKDGVFSRPLTSGTYYQSKFFESTDGTVFVYGSNSSTPGVKIFKNGVITTIISTSFNWQYISEGKDGTVYISSSQSNTGLYTYKDGVTTQITNAGNAYSIFGKKSDGTVYYSKSGLFSINNGVISQVSSATTNFTTYFEGSDGTELFGGDTIGLYMLLDGNFTKILTSNLVYNRFFEGDDSVIYVAGIVSGAGVHAIKNGVAKHIINSGGYLGLFFKATDGSVYTSCENTGTKGLWKLDYDNTMQLTSTSSTYKYYTYSDEGDLYAISTVAGIYNITKNTFVDTTHKWTLTDGRYLSTDVEFIPASATIVPYTAPQQEVYKLVVKKVLV